MLKNELLSSHFIANSDWNGAGKPVYIPNRYSDRWQNVQQVLTGTSNDHKAYQLFIGIKSLSVKNQDSDTFLQASDSSQKIKVSGNIVLSYSEVSEGYIIVNFIADIDKSSKPSSTRAPAKANFQMGNNSQSSEIKSYQPDDFIVLPPFSVAEFGNGKSPLLGGAKATYVDPLSLEIRESEWEAISDSIEISLWGFFKAVTTFRLGQVLRLPDDKSYIAGGIGGVTEQLSLQVKLKIYTVSISDWHGRVYYSALKQVKAIDFKKLSNTRRQAIEIFRTYRVMAGNRVVYTANSERIAGVDHTAYIANAQKNGFPNEDRIAPH